MPVNSEHADYTFNLPKWKKCRIVGVEGEDAVKEAGTMFLPMLEGTHDVVTMRGSSAYNNYKERASFFAATARTVEGISGAVFRKEPIVEFPESKKDYLNAVSADGADLSSTAKHLFLNVLVTGRHGLLLDLPETAKANEPPFLVGYKAESIINWRTARIRGKETLVMVVLKEVAHVPDSEDKFKTVVKEKIRVLYLGNPENNGDLVNPVYYIEIWEKVKNNKGNKEAYILESTSIPKIRGVPINYIPFVFFAANSLSPDVQKSPIMDIVNINISHYRSSADLEHGRHFTALPTAWVAGFPESQELIIGSSGAWVSENTNAHAGFLEFTGQGLGAIENALKQKEDQMAVLGARMLEAPKKSVEAADTHKIRKSGEESVTASLAGTISKGLEIILGWAVDWMGLLDKNVSVELNRDYTNIEMTPQMLTALMTAMQGGQISMDTWIYNLQRGELLPDGRTIEEELDLIDEHVPMPNNNSGNLDLGTNTQG